MEQEPNTPELEAYQKEKEEAAKRISVVFSNTDEYRKWTITLKKSYEYPIQLSPFSYIMGSKRVGNIRL